MERITKTLSFTVQIGDDLVFEILTWLPAKSLMRCKCVSKPWNTLIRHDPDFVKSHVARSRTRPSATHLMFELTVFRIICESAREEEIFSLQLAPYHYHCSDRRSEILISSNHCNGLVCFHEVYKRSRVYLYNITTGEMKALPFSLINLYGHTYNLFLGFNSVMEEYKLLHVISRKGPLKMKILTLGTNSWREIKSIPKLALLSLLDCIFLDGLLYWTLPPTDSYYIEYFDFREEEFGILSPPEYKNLMEPTTLWEKLVQYLPCNLKYEKRHLISDEVNKVLMKFNLDDPNLTKFATLQPEAETSNKTGHVLATPHQLCCSLIILI